MPGRSAGWVGQRDHFEGAPVAVERERTADDFVELLESKKLRDRKFAHGNNEPRPQEIDFIVHPGRAIPDLIRRRHPVAAGGRLAGKAAADGGKINPRANLRFIQLTEFVEPSKERAPSRPGKRPAQDRLPDPWRLTDEHHLAEDRSARNGRRQHSRAAPALKQSGDVVIEQLPGVRARTYGHDNPSRMLQDSGMRW